MTHPHTHPPYWHHATIYHWICLPAQVPQAVGGVARFTFLDLCGLPLGAADYMALARHFHTVFITSIPAMSMQVRKPHRAWHLPPSFAWSVMIAPTKPGCQM